MASTDSSRSNLGPLTTAVTYPAGCDVAVHESSGATIAYQAQTCSDNSNNAGGEQDNPDCWPPRLGGNLDGGAVLGGWGFYSPGLECPDGYVTACSATGRYGWEFQFPLLGGETGVGCCPTGFDCTTRDWGAQTCFSLATAGSFPTIQCSDRISQNYGYLEIPLTYIEATSGGSITGISELTSVSIYAPLFQLVHRPSDLPPTSAEPTSDAGIRTASSDPDDGPSASSGSTNGALPIGAQVGIGVGVAIAGLAIIGAALFFWKRRKRPAPVAARTPKSPGDIPGQKYLALQELPTHAPAPRSELSG